MTESDRWLPVPFELFVIGLPITYCYVFLMRRHHVFALVGVVAYVGIALLFTVSDLVAERRVREFFQRLIVLLLTLVPPAMVMFIK